MPSERRAGKGKNTKNWQEKKAVTEQTDGASIQLFISFLEVRCMLVGGLFCRW